MELLEAIKGRRSIRQYKATPVDDKTLQIVLEAARWAPSWANIQCWKFAVVRDPDLKNKLADTLRPVRPGGKNNASEAIKAAPILIVACAELEKSGYYQGKATTDKGDWCMFDVALAMANLTLAAYSVGLGTVHVGLFDAKEAANILGLPPNLCVIEMTPLGYPDQQPNAPRRKELSEIVFYDKYPAK